MWGKLCRGSAGISGFPIWVKLLCQIFFDTMDRDHDGIVNEKEMRNFYEGLIEVPKADLDKVTKEGYRAMTAVSTYLHMKRFRAVQLDFKIKMEYNYFMFFRMEDTNSQRTIMNFALLTFCLAKEFMDLESTFLESLTTATST